MLSAHLGDGLFIYCRLRVAELAGDEIDQGGNFGILQLIGESWHERVGAIGFAMDAMQDDHGQVGWVRSSDSTVLHQGRARARCIGTYTGALPTMAACTITAVQLGASEC